MKQQLLLAISVFVCLTDTVQGKSQFLRYFTAGAVCGASAFDVATTHVGISRGAIETNGTVSRNGRPLWGRMYAVNIGMCGGAIAIAAFNQVPTYLAVPLNMGLAAPKTWAGFHNIGVIRRLPGQTK